MLEAWALRRWQSLMSGQANWWKIVWGLPTSLQQHYYIPQIMTDWTFFMANKMKWRRSTLQASVDWLIILLICWD
jgi:hypothetical protein